MAVRDVEILCEWREWLRLIGGCVKPGMKSEAVSSISSAGMRKTNFLMGFSFSAALWDFSKPRIMPQTKMAVLKLIFNYI